MESTQCPLCGDAKFKVYCELPDASGVVRPVICKACGFVYLSPRMDAAELDAFYRADAWRSASAGGKPSEAYKRESHAKSAERLAYLERLARSDFKSVFDIGCGSGAFLEILKARGVRAVGLEPSDAMARHLEEELGIPVHREGFPEVLPKLAGEKFDLITSFHVLEHAPRPVEFLRGAAQLLEPGGILYLAVPDMNGPKRDLRHYFFRPVHLGYFTKASLTRSLAAAGFEVIAVEGLPVAGKWELRAIAKVGSPTQTPPPESWLGVLLMLRKYELSWKLKKWFADRKKRKSPEK